MSVIQTKSISGITSITTPSGADNLLTLHTNDGTERVRIDSTGTTKIVTGIVTTLTATTGIVTTLTSNNITGNSSIKVGTGITLSSDGDVYTTGITTLGGASAHVTRLYVASGGNKSDPIIRVTGDTDTGIYFPSAGTIGFSVNNDESFRVDSSSRLIVGHTASTTCSNGEEPFVQVKATDSRAGASYIRHSANASAGGIYLGKSRNATIGSNTIVQDDDELGRITFSGDDGTDINTAAAKIASYVDGTPGTNDMPGRLEFYTTADGASSVTHRMRIDSVGDVIIGNTFNSNTSINPCLNIGSSSASRPGIVIRGSSTNKGDISFCDNSGTDGSTGVSEGLIRYDHDGNHMYFHTADTQALQITSGGDLILGAQGNKETIRLSLGDNSPGNNAPYGDIQFSGRTDHTDVCYIRGQAFNNANGTDGMMLFYTADNTSGSGTDLILERLRIRSDGICQFTNAGEGLYGEGVTATNWGNAMKVDMADEASFTISSCCNTGALIAVGSTKDGSGNIKYRHGLFFSDYGTNTVTEIHDPSNTFATSDTNGYVCVYATSPSNGNVVIKNRLGHTAGICVTILRFLGN